MSPALSPVATNLPLGLTLASGASANKTIDLDARTLARDYGCMLRPVTLLLTSALGLIIGRGLLRMGETGRLA